MAVSRATHPVVGRKSAFTIRIVRSGGLQPEGGLDDKLLLQAAEMGRESGGRRRKEAVSWAPFGVGSFARKTCEARFGDAPGLGPTLAPDVGRQVVVAFVSRRVGP